MLFCRRELDIAPVGTTIQVSSLFSKYPVRLQQMESKKEADYKRISHLLLTYSIIHPQIRFQLFHQSKSSFDSRKNNNVLESITSLYSSVLSKELAEYTWLNETHNFQTNCFFPKSKSKGKFFLFSFFYDIILLFYYYFLFY